MNNKNIPIVVAVASLVLCGCPGACAAFFGAISALVSFMPGADINVGGSSDPMAALTMGLVSLCGGLVMMGIAAGAGFWAWRARQQAS